MSDAGGWAEGLAPLPGGWSGETFVSDARSDAGGEAVVVRIYGERSAARGPLAPETDAAVLRLMRGIVPVPAVLEVRRGDADRPGLLVTELLPGERADLVLPRLDPSGRRRLGVALGGVLDRLVHVPTPYAGLFTGPDLSPGPMPSAYADLPSYVESVAGRLDHWPADLLRGLAELADAAQDILDRVRRTCFVHGDLNPKNVLVDPDRLVVTGVLDWEFAHSGSPYTDVGNLLRFERDPAFTDAVLAGWGDLDSARAADLFALVELASREVDPIQRNPVTGAADRLLRHLARTGDPGSWPPA